MANPQKEDGYTSISNEIMDALAKFRIPGEARQMLDVIIRKTYGYNKKIDQISTSQFCQATELKGFIIHRARKRLLLANLITVIKNANNQILSYSFQKDYDKWIPLAKKITVSKNDIYCMQKSAKTVTNNDVHNIHKDNIQKTRQYPTKDEALDFFRNNSASENDGIEFWEYYEMVGWVAGKKPIKKWTMAAKRWIRKNKKGKADGWFKPKTGGILRPLQEESPNL